MDLYPLLMEHTTQTRLIIGKMFSYHWQIKTFSQLKGWGLLKGNEADLAR